MPLNIELKLPSGSSTTVARVTVTEELLGANNPAGAANFTTLVVSQVESTASRLATTTASDTQLIFQENKKIVLFVLEPLTGWFGRINMNRFAKISTIKEAINYDVGLWDVYLDHLRLNDDATLEGIGIKEGATLTVYVKAL